MIWWILLLAIVVILSYLSDVGLLPFIHELRVPYLNASLLSLLILLCTLGVLGRMLYKVKKGKTEILARRIMELEKALKKKE